MIEYRQSNEGRVVLVDTSVWVMSVRRPRSAVADELGWLLERDEVATTEIIVGEVLQGARTEEDFAEWADRMDALHFFPGSLEIWRKASHTSFELRTKGLTTPLADIVIATIALENQLPVYAVDDHFSRVSGLSLHEPSNDDIRGRMRDTGTKEDDC